MTAREVKDALRRRHGADGGSGEWVCIEEAFSGWTSLGGGIDLLAIGAWKTAKAPGLPGAGRAKWCGCAREPGCERCGGSGLLEDARHPIVAYEVKVSRSDMRRELYGYQPGEGSRAWNREVPPWPGKAYWALERSHYFLFAVPKGLLRDDELQRRSPDDQPEAQMELAPRRRGRPLWVPPEAGLLEVDEAGRCHVRIEAPLRRARPLTAGEVAELIRHAVDPAAQRRLRAENSTLRAEVQRLNEAVTDLERTLDDVCPNWLQRYREEAA